MEITVWGDSLPQGTGAGVGQDFPSVLATLSGVVVNNFGVAGETSSQVLTRVLADSAHVDDVVIFWMGHNNDGLAGRPTRDQNVLDIASAVAHLGDNQKYLVLSMLNRTYEPKGSADYPAVIAMNKALADAYGNHFIDIRSYLVHQYNPATPEGNADHENDLPAFPADSIHRTAAGYAAVAVPVNARIQELGWLNGD